MEPILVAVLALLPTIAADVPAFLQFWNLVKPGAPPTTVTAVDALLAAMNTKLDADEDAAAKGAAQAPQSPQPQAAASPAGRAG